ncbi:MAG TPA: Gfo/Idh/MocA family oxidoreductase [Planctomycetaceae bacterium]|jgi:WD40 repeat protein/predicted dehydrogenase|nr:Gfo/Idh/MocA family oxidoreductase [Planctomycetaceae bacterium]
MTNPLRRFPLSLLSAVLLIAGGFWHVSPHADAAPGDGSSGQPAVLPPQHVWDEQPDWITALVFLKDGHHFGAGTYEQLLVFDAGNDGPPKSVPVQSGYLKALALSPDGKTLACGHYQAVTLLDATTFAVKRTLGEHAGYVTGLAFSPDGRQLATATEAADSESARVFDVATGKALHVLTGHRFPVRAIAFSADGKKIATAAGDEDRVTQPGEVKVWNAADGKQLNSFSNPKRAATAVAFSPDGKYLASSGFDERVIIYDLAKGKATSFFGGHARPTNAVLFARGGAVVLSAAGGRARGGNEVKLWERESGNELGTIVGHTARIDAIALSPDQSLLATGGYDKRVAVWDVKSMLKGDAAQRGTATAESSAKSAAKTPADKMAATKPSPAKGSPKAPIRVGMIGLDTSHCAAFTQALNDPKAAPDIAGFRVVAAYPRGSADIVSSTERIPEYTKDFRKRGVEIVDSISALLPKVDVVLLETNDGRPHLEQALAVMKAGKPLFIDKPIAGSLADAIAIFEASKRYHVPVFSSSSLRFSKNTLEARNGKVGPVQRCETTSPCHLEKTHPDLFWYGIHGVESLFTVMGTGCKSVRRTQSTATDDVVVGQWEGGRVGTFHGTRSKGGYGGKATGTKGTLDVGAYDGYRPLVVAIVDFFRTGIAPVKEDETLEIYAFMEAADESKRQHGAEVTLASVMTKARVEADRRLRQLQ